VFSKEMIYEKRLSFGRKTWFAKNDNIIWNYVWMDAMAQQLGGDYAPNIPILGRGRQSCLTA
jgi:hypothetical protein